MQEQLADTVRRRRLELGLTQKDLAEKAGMQRSWVSNIELGLGGSPTLQRIEALAVALNTTVHDLVSGDQTEPSAILDVRLSEARRAAADLIDAIDAIEQERGRVEATHFDTLTG